MTRTPREVTPRYETHPVELARQGIYPVATREPSIQLKQNRRTPASRQFPKITVEMSDSQRIEALARHGLSARKIRPYLSADFSVRSINRRIYKLMGPARKGRNSDFNHISPSMMPYVEECLRRLGKDRFTCELCGDSVPSGCIVHHTRYEGATVYDLMYVCGSCNTSRENRGLD